MRRIIRSATMFMTVLSLLSCTVAVNNCTKLKEEAYHELPLGAIKPEGWLQLQLLAMKDGMTGHLDELYSNCVGDRNAWIGGDGDTWERGPYWIDGLLPLAYILDDELLKAKANRWVEAIINSQKEDGYFGPDTDREPEPDLKRDMSHDWWPKMVALKILKQYYMATGDDRVIPFMDKYFRYQLNMLPEKPLNFWSNWGANRAGDNLEVVYWLYDITGEKYLLELGEIIHSQSTSWTEMFENGAELRTQGSIHCVNLGQGFKEPAVYYRRTKDERYLQAMKNGVETIKPTIGLPTGLWSGDELIHFGDPVHGSELCTAVEMMFSLEETLKISGDLQWADYLERIAYNALPTQATDDYSARQYFQQTNQIECTRNTTRLFSTPHDDTDQVFGILNGYPCCTCNMHQGWPKFTQNLWYSTSDGGLAALIYAPSSVKAKVAGGTEVCIREDTFYPFDETVRFTVNTNEGRGVAFPLKLRIPEWCDSISVAINGEAFLEGGQAATVISIEREWKNGDEIVLGLPMKVRCSRWYDDAAVIERGPLVYALKMNEKWEKKAFEPSMAEKYGNWYYEVTSDSKWNYCLSYYDLEETNFADKFTVVKRDVDRSLYPWNLENAPLMIKATGRELLSWQEHRGSTGPVQYYTWEYGEVGEESEIELIPYGCTTLRITEFPVRK